MGLVVYLIKVWCSLVNSKISQQTRPEGEGKLHAWDINGTTLWYRSSSSFHFTQKNEESKFIRWNQGCNARKVISEVYASFVLQRECKHKTDVTDWHGIHLSLKKTMNYSGNRKLLCELSKLSNLMLLTSSDTKRTLMHLFLFTNSAQRELVSICTQSIHDRN